MNTNIGYVFGAIIGVLLSCLMFVSCGKDEQERKQSKDYDPAASLDMATLQHNGYTYNCVKYGKAGSGGIWCDRISGP